MALEIERKWLVKNTPELVEALAERVWSHLRITQGYIFRGKTSSVRVRDSVVVVCQKNTISMTDATGSICVKNKIGDSLVKRKEYEYSIPYSDARELLDDLDGKITKERFVTKLDSGLVLEIDFFKDKLDGLVVAEIEFPDEESASREVVFPYWLSVVKEVSEDPRFLNCNLIDKSYSDLT